MEECQNDELHCHGPGAVAKDTLGAVIIKIMIDYYVYVRKSTSAIEIKQTDSGHPHCLPQEKTDVPKTKYAIVFATRSEVQVISHPPCFAAANNDPPELLL